MPTRRLEKTAVAVFVKTINQTPLKTRLAKGVGTDFAHEFYRRSCRAISDVISATADVAGFWAVAEGASCFHQWPTMTAMEQGDGGLGDRLNYVYNQLIERYQTVILLGADAPQISSAQLSAAISIANRQEFALGSAADGGFYLLAGALPVTNDLWTSVTYSSPDTLTRIKAALASVAPVSILPQLTDVDTAEDLPRLIAELEQIADTVTPMQAELKSWLLNSRPW